MFWKNYFRLLLGVLVVGIVLALAGMRRFAAGGFDLVDLAFDALSLVGLYGYAWKRQVFIRPFWRAFVPVYIMWTLYLLTVSPWRITESRLPEAILITPFLVPLYYALVRYAYRAPVADAQATASIS